MPAVRFASRRAALHYRRHGPGPHRAAGAELRRHPGVRQGCAGLQAVGHFQLPSRPVGAADPYSLPALPERPPSQPGTGRVPGAVGMRARDGRGRFDDRSRPCPRPSARPRGELVGHPRPAPERPHDQFLHEDAVRVRSGVRLWRIASRLGRALGVRVHPRKHLGA
ncbi:hypothetical protein D3C87_1510980 [compost metagenome]